jgi:hypothetical protein
MDMYEHAYQSTTARAAAKYVTPSSPNIRWEEVKPPLRSRPARRAHLAQLNQPPTRVEEDEMAIKQ